METKLKICQECKLEKPLSEFYKHKSRQDGLRANCKECGKKAAREFYRRNPSPYKQRSHVFRKKKEKIRREYIDNTRVKYGCQICKENDPDVLDYHHFKGKDFNVTQHSLCSNKKLMEEINKCIILCSNCHRKVHAGTAFVTNDMLCKEKLLPRLDGKEYHNI